ncbi:MAG TPA: hypothetical protein PK020_05150 [Ilumatobacteraceae bacterium]|nr:hypothetical protein [Ilumatobacteraceae bacterium]HRB04294.1 hypothetical protein [Ilumatobacteraceae bacterium]
MSLRSGCGRATLVCLLIVAATACSNDDTATDSTGGTSPASLTTAPVGSMAAGGSDAPQTTFMPDCTQMPSNTDLSALVGVPMDLGYVSGSGTCEFVGLNDQTRTVVLSLFVDPTDQATFLDLQSSLGAPTPIDDPVLSGAMVGANSVVYVSTAEGIYTVLTTVTDAPASEQVPLSVAVLKHWLAP